MIDQIYGPSNISPRVSVQQIDAVLPIMRIKRCHYRLVFDKNPYTWFKNSHYKHKTASRAYYAPLAG